MAPRSHRSRISRRLGGRDPKRRAQTTSLGMRNLSVFALATWLSASAALAQVIEQFLLGFFSGHVRISFPTAATAHKLKAKAFVHHRIVYR